MGDAALTIMKNKFLVMGAALALLTVMFAGAAIADRTDAAPGDVILFEGVDYTGQRWQITNGAHLIVTGNDMWVPMDNTGNAITLIEGPWILLHADITHFTTWDYYNIDQSCGLHISYSSPTEFEIYLYTSDDDWKGVIPAASIPDKTRDPLEIVKNITVVSQTDASEIAIASFLSTGGYVNLRYMSTFQPWNFSFTDYTGTGPISIPVQELRFRNSEWLYMDNMLAAYDNRFVNFRPIVNVTTIDPTYFWDAECPFYDLDGVQITDPAELAGRIFVGHSEWETIYGVETEKYGYWTEIEREDPGEPEEAQAGINWMPLVIGLVLIVIGLLVMRINPMFGAIIIGGGLAAMGFFGWGLMR